VLCRPLADRCVNRAVELGLLFLHAARMRQPSVTWRRALALIFLGDLFGHAVVDFAAVPTQRAVVDLQRSATKRSGAWRRLYFVY
jgi:hypothetical protein